jgi:hypothetical protein
MPAITATNMAAFADIVVTETTLNGTDTLVYNANKKQFLILRNDTGGPLSPTIVGDEADTVQGPGIEATDVSGGYDLSAIADGTSVCIALDTIRGYLAGDVSITSGTGLIAALLEF